MKNDKEINENLYGCVSVGACMVFIIFCCLLLALCSCKPTQKIIEVEKWQHDTTTVIDTVHIKDIVVQHDSVYTTEYVTQYVKDSTQTNVAWKYYTYDKYGNVSSLLDYNSSTQHGSTSHNVTGSTQTSVSNNLAVHEESGGHIESSGTTTHEKEKTETKPQLNGWQKFIQGLGYIFFVLLVLGLMFGGMRLYGYIKKR